MPENQGQKHKPQTHKNPWDGPKDEGSGPTRPKTGDLPDVDSLLKKMRNVGKDNAKKYLQKEGQ